MEEILRYRSYDGKCYDTVEECLRADKDYVSANSKQDFSEKLRKLADLVLVDGKRHEIGIKCGDYPLFVSKLVSGKGGKNVHLHVDAKVENEFVIFFRTTYYSYCKEQFKDKIDEVLWNNKEKWISEFQKLYEERVKAENAKISEIVNSIIL